ncbi:MAG: SCP2 sterol-binding domain-containing protein, partial [Anaerolineales bacterium]|nr:SCP2 sterol-binding domain-containing protein [Anaerolineales bacterium]
SSAKLGLVGLANSLAIEGKKRNICVNAIAPVAGSRMTETILPADLVQQIKPEYVAPLVAYLCHENTTVTGELFELGAGWVSRLRWQRSKGVFFPLDGSFSPESIADKWTQINDFEDPDYPTSAMAAFDPITANLKSLGAKPKTGNEYVDLDKALGYELAPRDMVYTEKDLSLYALSIGAAADPLDPSELKFTYELNQSGFAAFPTFGVTFPFTILDQIGSVPGLKFNPMMLLHGEQYLELKRPLPLTATITTNAKIAQIYDKGSGALVYVDVVSSDEKGAEVAFNRVSLFIRGIGNFGGERGPSSKINLPPQREPDAIHQDLTNENQALLYRLSSGDRNPLHADPAMAAIGGFDKPILHGLCTFGFAARAVVKHFADNDPARFKSIQVRFSKHVFPGETLITEMWQESDTHIIFRTKVAERDEVVLSNAVVELHAPVMEETIVAESATALPKSVAIFEEINGRIQNHPEWIEKVGAIYQFNISGENGGEYIVDLKNSPGSAHPGSDPAAGCTLNMAYADFRAMLKGEIKPEMAFMSGKLQVSGNMLLATKLGPLFSQR